MRDIEEDLDFDDDSKICDDKATTESSYEANTSLEGAFDCPRCRRRLISEGGSTVDSVEDRLSRTRKPSSVGGYAPSPALALPKNPWDGIWPYVSLPKEVSLASMTNVNEEAKEVVAVGDVLEESGDHRIIDEAEALGRYASLKSKVHAFDYWRSLPLSSRDEINWTHFGGR